MPTFPTDAESGFTIVEALCALAILALAMVSLLEGAGDASRGSARLAELTAERTLLRSIIAEDMARPRRASYPVSGSDAPYRWTVTAEPAVAEPDGGGWRLHRITYTIRGPHRVTRAALMRLLPSS